jgi:hypothetical protein
MIDHVYHSDKAMALAMTKTGSASTAGAPQTALSPECNPAVAGILDHLAEALAREYVRLMEEAAKNHGGVDCQPEHEEG